MKKQHFTFLVSLVLAITLLAQPVQSVAAENIPLTGPSLENALPAPSAATALAPFAASVAGSGNPNLAAGLFVRGVFAAPIVQQPASAPGFVSTEAGAATQFGMAAQYGTVALLAHNYLLGERFFDIAPRKILTLVYGDGHTRTYRVREILKYQALSPNSPYSDFVDLNDPNAARLTATDLFYKVYTNANTLVLQTCIEANGDPSWGRIFVVAEPVNLVTALQPTRDASVSLMALR